tara:strand:- start:590 stop:1261 length:672 start_codon:yes stop_codon:yes gene_type:complete
MKDKLNIKYYPLLNRGDWAQLKLEEVLTELPNLVVSDIGAGFGWFGDIVKKNGLELQSFDQVRKNSNVIIWDLNYPAPPLIKSPGFIVMLEVIEHLSNPELSIKNISNHIAEDGYIVMSSPNPFYSKNKFEFLFKNRFYAFQKKHLIEHHVFLPLPHVVKFYMKNYGFELIEYAVLGKNDLPKMEFKLNYLKSLLRFWVEKILIGNSVVTKGNTQAFLFKKSG